MSFYTDRFQRTTFGLSVASGPTPMFIFVTKEYDLADIDWVQALDFIGVTAVGSIRLGPLLKYMGIAEDHVFGVYVPTEPLSRFEEEPKVRHVCRAARSTNTFTSRVEEPPVQCIVAVAGDVSVNNATVAQLVVNPSWMSESSLISASVGLRDSDAEIILLADEFKKGVEYRISDFSVEYDLYVGESE